MLPDDEYRSLAAFARDAGAFRKISVPLEAFRWADLFRSRLPLPSSDEQFANVFRNAIELAQSDIAIGLPGFCGKSH